MPEEKMREDFEAAIAIESGEPITAIFLSRKDGSYATSALRFAWWAWQKSRMDLVIELPPAPAEPEEPEEAIDDSHMDAFHAANRMRSACQKAIEAAGLKVTP
jgi:hypothetical protein